MPSTSTNSYSFNTRDFIITQSHCQTWKMKSIQKVSPPSYLVSVVVWSTLMLRHEAGSPYNFNTQFPICKKLPTHVEDVTLNTSIHQYCVISIVPTTGHRKSDKHHLIYMTFTAWFLDIIHYKMTCK